jgi:hypothetical protein
MEAARAEQLVAELKMKKMWKKMKPGGPIRRPIGRRGRGVGPCRPSTRSRI